MAHKTCTSCRGTGSGTTTERVPNPAGGMFQEIQVRKRCMHCVGSGFLAGLAGRKLFNGPLRFLLTWLKYLLIVACAGAVLAVAARVNHGGI